LQNSKFIKSWFPENTFVNSNFQEGQSSDQNKNLDGPSAENEINEFFNLDLDEEIVQINLKNNIIDIFSEH